MWPNLRDLGKVNAQLSSYREKVFGTLRDKIDLFLKHSDWKKKEAAILTLGAISEGCNEAVRPFSDYLIPYLIESLMSS